MHLADAFIQSDLGNTFVMSVCVCFLGIEPTTFALLTQYSNHWATGTQEQSCTFWKYSTPVTDVVPFLWECCFKYLINLICAMCVRTTFKHGSLFSYFIAAHLHRVTICLLDMPKPTLVAVTHVAGNHQLSLKMTFFSTSCCMCEPP